LLEKIIFFSRRSLQRFQITFSRDSNHYFARLFCRACGCLPATRLMRQSFERPALRRCCVQLCHRAGRLSAAKKSQKKYISLDARFGRPA
jgi:hypothetical protein